MKVTLLNPDEVKKLFTDWGQTSAICYDTHMKDPTPIGKGCMKSGHYSGSRGDYIKFLVTECPRFAIDQAVRHEVGVFKNVQSFRYCDRDTFGYEVPSEILGNEELLAKYNKHMEDTMALYEEIQSYVISEGKTKERANEQARYVLPMATHSAFVIGFTVEALENFMNKRLCLRAEDTIRQMALLMKEETLKVLPELKDKLVPNCKKLMYCPEGKKSCGAVLTKEEMEFVIKHAVKEAKEKVENKEE